MKSQPTRLRAIAMAALAIGIAVAAPIVAAATSGQSANAVNGYDTSPGIKPSSQR